MRKTPRPKTHKYLHTNPSEIINVTARSGRHFESQLVKINLQCSISFSHNHLRPNERLTAKPVSPPNQLNPPPPKLQHKFGTARRPPPKSPNSFSAGLAVARTLVSALFATRGAVS